MADAFERAIAKSDRIIELCEKLIVELHRGRSMAAVITEELVDDAADEGVDTQDERCTAAGDVDRVVEVGEPWEVVRPVGRAEELVAGHNTTASNTNTNTRRGAPLIQDEVQLFCARKVFEEMPLRSFGANAELYADRAQAHTKLGKVVANANKAIECDTSMHKAYLQEGAACVKLEEYQTAKAALELGSSYAYGDSRFTRLMEECDERIAEKTKQMPVKKAEGGSVAPSGASNMPAAIENKEDGANLENTQPMVEVLSKSKYRHDYYNSATEVVLTIFAKDIGVRSGAILYIEKDFHITEFQEEILVGCLSVVSLLGSLSGGRTSDAIDRKWTMGLGAIVFQTGAAIMTFAPSFTALMIGRLLAGVGVGLGAMVSGVYIAEISPASARGSLTSLPEICINFGILLGYVSNYAFSDLSEHINWKIMLGVGILPSVCIGFALFVIPESPRWLMMEKRVPEARAVLLQISESEAEVIAKGEAQGMVSKFLGIMLGIALGNHIGSSVPLALISFTGVTAVHMYCNLKSYQSIELRTLNPYRASLVFSEYLLSGQIPSVKEVNDEEPLFLNMSIGAPHKQSKILSAQANDILIMSLAPRDSHEDQVQFAWERGVSAVIGYSLLVETKLGNFGVVENDLKVARNTGSQLVMLIQEMFSEALEILHSKKDGFLEILQERSSVLSGFPAYILGHSGLQCFSHTSNAAAAQLVEPVHVSRMTESSLQQFSVYVSQSPDFLQKTPDTMDGLKAPNVMDGFTTGSDLGSNLVPGFHSIEGRLNSLLDGDGGISKRKDATKGYLKLLLVTAVEGDNDGGASKSNRMSSAWGQASFQREGNVMDRAHWTWPTR